MSDIIVFAAGCLLGYLVYRCGYAKGKYDALDWIQNEQDDFEIKVGKMSDEEIEEIIKRLTNEERNKKED